MQADQASGILFVVGFIAAPSLNIAGWWQLGKSNPSFSNPREALTIACLILNSAVIVFPGIYAFSQLKEVMTWNEVLFCCLGASAFSFILGIFALKHIRWMLMFSSIATAVSLVTVSVGGL